MCRTHRIRDGEGRSRGRDHGLPDYNTVRAAYGLKRVTTFSQVSSNSDVQDALEDLYGTVDNIDVWVGALAEDHLPGSSVGALITAGLQDQLRRCAKGDRFFHDRDPDLKQLAVTAVIASAVLSVALMLWSPDSGSPTTHSTRSAREALTQFYGKDGADLEPYQKLLRQAAVEHSQGRTREERRLYLRTLDLLNSSDATSPRNLNGLTGRQSGRGKNSDRELRELLETLVATP